MLYINYISIKQEENFNKKTTKKEPLRWASKAEGVTLQSRAHVLWDQRILNLNPPVFTSRICPWVNNLFISLFFSFHRKKIEWIILHRPVVLHEMINMKETQRPGLNKCGSSDFRIQQENERAGQTERSTAVSTLPCVRHSASGKLPCNRVLSSVLCDDLERRAGGSSRGRDICIHVPGDLVVKNQPANAGDRGSIPDSKRSPGEGNGNLFQYSYLENPMDKGAWHATVNGITKSWTWLSDRIHTHSWFTSMYNRN